MRLIYTVVSFIIVCNAIAQNKNTEFQVSFESGYGTYSMKDLKALNQLFETLEPINPVLTTNYPAYVYYRPSVSLQFGWGGLGFAYAYQSTGSRLSRQDYSGDYHFDNRLHSNLIGLQSSFNIFNKKSYRLALNLNTGFDYTSFRMSEYLKIEDTVLINMGRTYNSVNGYIEPGSKFTYFISSVGLSAYFGYQYQFVISNLVDDFTNKIYNPSNNKRVNVDWSGIRLGLAISYSFHHVYKETLQPK